MTKIGRATIALLLASTFALALFGVWALWPAIWLAWQKSELERRCPDFELRLYSVADLLKGESDIEPAVKSLQDLVTWGVAPNSWERDGGSGHIQYVPRLRSLLVCNLPETQAAIERMLRSLRTRTDLLKDERDECVNVALAQPISVDIEELPIGDAMEELARLAGVDVRLDRTSLRTDGVDPTTPVTLHAKETPLNVCLRQLATPSSLQFFVYDGSLWITPATTACPSPELRLYPLPSMAGRYNNLNAIIKSLFELGRPESWEWHGGEGSVRYFAPTSCVLVWQYKYAHDEIRRTLAELGSVPAPAN